MEEVAYKAQDARDTDKGYPRQHHANLLRCKCRNEASENGCSAGHCESPEAEASRCVDYDLTEGRYIEERHQVAEEDEEGGD